MSGTANAPHREPSTSGAPKSRSRARAYRGWRHVADQHECAVPEVAANDTSVGSTPKMEALSPRKSILGGAYERMDVTAVANEIFMLIDESL